MIEFDGWLTGESNVVCLIVKCHETFGAQIIVGDEADKRIIVLMIAFTADLKPYDLE